MIDEIYAYWEEDRNGNIRFQTLEDHIRDSLEALNNIRDTKIWRYYASFCQNAEKWMKLAIVFHDMGKVFYQENKKRNKKGRYLSFVGHEFISTYLVDGFLGIWLNKDLENRLEDYKNFRWLVYSSILYHHHAMGLRSRERLNEIKVCGNCEFDNIAKKASEIVRKYSMEFDVKPEEFFNLLKQLKLTKLVEGSDILLLDRNVISDIYRYVDELNVVIWRKFAGEKDFRRRMILATNMLIMADYIGSKERGEEKTEFGRVVDESVELYREILQAIR